MSVLSWRWRSSSMGVFGTPIGLILGSATRVSFVVVLLAAGGCMPKRPEYSLMFDTGNKSKAEIEQIDKECTYEAAKAVVGIKIGEIKAEENDRLTILCAEAKGVKFVRKEYREGHQGGRRD